MRYILLFVVISFTQLNLSAQDSINWLSLEEAIQLNKETPKKIVIDIYTNWCKWCKKMDENAFQDPSLIKYLNKNYYAVKFDADTKKNISFNGKTYKYHNKGKNGHHELARELLQGKLSYPSFVFLDEKAKVIQPISTYLEALKFKMIAAYFATNSYKTISWSSFAKRYRKNHHIKK